MNNRTGLVPPYSGNAGDGFAGTEPTKSLAEEIAEEKSAVRASALRDAVTFLVDNALNDSGHDVRMAVNIRHNLSWPEVDGLIAKARPLAAREVERVRAERARAEQAVKDFESLAALFAEPVSLEKNAGDYTLSGLSESQVRSVADLLAAGCSHD